MTRLAVSSKPFSPKDVDSEPEVSGQFSSMHRYELISFQNVLWGLAPLQGSPSGTPFSTIDPFFLILLWMPKVSDYSALLRGC